jgi:hypothetical protein
LAFPVTVLRRPRFVRAGMLFWHSRFFEMAFNILGTLWGR